MGFCRGWGFHGGKFQVQIWFFACEAGWSWVARCVFFFFLAVGGGEARVDYPVKIGLGVRDVVGGEAGSDSERISKWLW